MKKAFSVDNTAKWLTLASAAVAAGLLPKGWAKGVSLATAALTVLTLLQP